MKKICIVLICLILMAGCTQPAADGEPGTGEQTATKTKTKTPAVEEDTEGYKDISAEEFRRMIDENPDVIVIDVSPVFEEKHIPGAVNYYVGDGSLDAAIPTLDKTKTYLVYCHVDSASIAGAQKLVDAGFMNVYRLEGNFAAWEAAGYPVETGDSEEDTAGYKDISAEEFRRMIDENPDVIVIDVSPVFEEKHIPGAVNYYVGDGSLDAAIPTLDKTKTYLVYCHVDSASIAGAQKLVDAGFMNVYRLEGNFAAWEAAGYPVETGK